MAIKKPLTPESITLFQSCGLSEGEYSLLSNSVASDTLDVEPAGRAAYVRRKLFKAQERAAKSAEFQAKMKARRSEFKVVPLAPKPGQPAMYAINGFKKGRVVVDKEAWDFIQANREAITLAIK